MPKIIAKIYFSLPDGSIQEAAVPGYPVLIGKAPGNDIVIPDSGISRQHASIRMQNGQYVISDLGSLNGIYINGKKLIADEARALHNGDKIQMGRVKAVFSLEEVPTGAIKSDAYSTHVDTDPKPPAKPAVVKTPKAPEPEPPPLAPLAIKYKVAMTGQLLLPNQPEAPAQGAPLRVALDKRYELLDQQRMDDTGTVYKAKRTLLGDVVSIRVLRPELVNDPVAVERFRRQAQVAARIKHPNSVQVYDFGYTKEGAAYIVEESLRGRTLRDLILKERGLSLPRVVGLVNQIAGAVHAAHQSGIVLRDLKPETIFIETSSSGRDVVKVNCYGLAKVDDSISGGVQLTGPLGVFGTPQYMAPEQWTGQQLDSRTDVYALGVIIFELLTGTLPFDSDNPMHLAQMHLSGAVPDLSDYGRGDMDEGVSAVVTRSLAKEPFLRQPTVLDLAQELEAVSGNKAGVIGRALNRLTGVLPIAPVVVQQPAAAVAGEVVLPSVVAQAEAKGGGVFNITVMALMAEAFFSRLSSGLIKTAVPLYALLVFGLDITSVMLLSLLQNIVPLLLRGFFGSLADKYGKKPVFMISLAVRTLVGLLYTFANVPTVLFAVSVVRGIADSAKGPSASAMIADATDEKNMAQAYSWYTTTKSTSGGIGEALAAFALSALLVLFIGSQTVTTKVAILEKRGSGGQPIEQFFSSPDEIVQSLISHKGEPVRVERVEERTIAIKDVPVEELPRVVAIAPLKRTLNVIFWVSTLFSLFSLILVAVFIKEKKKEKKDKKDKEKAKAGALDAPQQQPNVYAFALLGAALTAPAYMVTGEFFTLLAIKLNVTAGQLSGIKLFAETLIPLFFGPFFGWVADRIGPGKVIALRSIANLITSVLFWWVPSFAGTALLGTMIGTARAIDEIGKAAFKPTWGAIAAKVSSYNLSSRSKTMGILEGGVDASDLIFPQLAGLLLAKLGIGPLMLVRAILAIVSEIYGHLLMRKYKI